MTLQTFYICCAMDIYILLILDNGTIHPSIGTILCAERWCCLSSLLGCWAQSWMGHHSDTGYQ